MKKNKALLILLLIITLIIVATTVSNGVNFSSKNKPELKIIETKATPNKTANKKEAVLPEEYDLVVWDKMPPEESGDRYLPDPLESDIDSNASNTTTTQKVNKYTPEDKAEYESLWRGNSRYIIWDGKSSQILTIKVVGANNNKEYSVVGKKILSIKGGMQVWHVPCDFDESQKFYKLIFIDEIIKSIVGTSSPFEISSENKIGCDIDPTLPHITSINPSSGPLGTVVEIQGERLSGFEGDMYVFLERADGKTFWLWDISNSSLISPDSKYKGTYLRVIIKDPCVDGELEHSGDYSGFAQKCTTTGLPPGNYKIYSNSWSDRKSNVVNFTITE